LETEQQIFIKQLADKRAVEVRKNSVISSVATPSKKTKASPAAGSTCKVAKKTNDQMVDDMIMNYFGN